MHEKHRQRLREKLINSGDNLKDHELLEILLFYALPRVNTNDIAHELITTFGSLEKVFLASVDSLMRVKGVGEKTAVFLNTIGKIYKKTKPSEQDFPEFFSYAEIKEPVKNLFKGLKDEAFIAFFLDSKRRIISKSVICDHSPYKVDIDVTEFSKQVIAHKPMYVVIAHNHLSGNYLPTDDDDKTTEKLCLVLRLYNVDLVDHLIVTTDNVYSYYYENRMEKIKNKIEQNF